jgi:histone H1/5
MARPKRGNFATGEAGLARYKEALKKYLAKTKKTTKPEVKKPVAKKPVAKKPATKKPAAKKPAAKKPVAKKPVAKKPAITKTTTRPKRTANSLKIKKAANTAAKTTKQVIKKATPVVKKAASTVRKKAGEAKQAVGKRVTQVKKIVNKKSPNKRPTTAGQKLASKANKAVKSGVKQSGRNLAKLAKGIAKDPKSLVKGVKGAGVSYLAERATSGLINRAFKPKGMKQSEYAKKLQEMKGKRNIVRSVKNIASKIRGKSGESSTQTNINKQKKS